ncbi:MAG: hypothetical protein ACJ789_10875 [Thermomicrobiales bacterium]
MPGYGCSVVYAMAREMYGVNEANRQMTCFYGLDADNADQFKDAKDQERRIETIGRRITEFVSSSLAALL